MRNLMYEITCSDIRITELELKRIRLCKKQLLKNKPFIVNKKKNKIWQDRLNKLNKDEEIIISKLQDAYNDLSEFL